jgi:hypothetical protein
LLLTNSGSSVDYPRSLRQWVSHQRYCFALKHGNTNDNNNSIQSSSIRSATRTLTCFRELMLHETNFQFHVDQDESLNQEKWNVMYEELRQFFLSHGHVNVNCKLHSKLFGWIRTQRDTLSVNRKLASTKNQCLYLLRQLGIDFQRHNTLSR